jgi:hypothetical protein
LEVWVRALHTPTFWDRGSKCFTAFSQERSLANLMFLCARSLLLRSLTHSLIYLLIPCPHFPFSLLFSPLLICLFLCFNSLRSLSHSFSHFFSHFRHRCSTSSRLRVLLHLLLSLPPLQPRKLAQAPRRRNRIIGYKTVCTTFCRQSFS